MVDTNMPALIDLENGPYDPIIPGVCRFELLPPSSFPLSSGLCFLSCIGTYKKPVYMIDTTESFSLCA